MKCPRCHSTIDSHSEWDMRQCLRALAQHENELRANLMGISVATLKRYAAGAAQPTPAVQHLWELQGLWPVEL